MQTAKSPRPERDRRKDNRFNEQQIRERVSQTTPPVSAVLLETDSERRGEAEHDRALADIDHAGQAHHALEHLDLVVLADGAGDVCLPQAGCGYARGIDADGGHGHGRSHRHVRHAGLPCHAGDDGRRVPAVVPCPLRR